MKINLIINLIFLLITISYYILLLKKDKTLKANNVKNISFIVPAHNEERYIRETIESIINAKSPGYKEIIVVEDGSTDNTLMILKKLAKRYNNVKILLNKKQKGKSYSLNRALSYTKYDIVAVVDGDSLIEKKAIEKGLAYFNSPKVGAVTGIVKVKNRKSLIGMWLHIEQLYNSLMRHILSKVNANITTPGPLSFYSAKALREIKGFSVKGFSEDADVTIRLIRKGYLVRFAHDIVTFTYMPVDIKGFFRQRFRFIRGSINIFKRHLKINNTLIDLYTLPIFLFNYVQGVIMGSFITYQIINGYIKYFYSHGIIFNLSVGKFIFYWFSIFGFIKWFLGIFSGTTPLNPVNLLGIMVSLLSYPLLFYSVYKWDKKVDFFHIIPLMFMFPFWLLIMILNIISIPEFFNSKQYNIWKKNE